MDKSNYIQKLTTIVIGLLLTVTSFSQTVDFDWKNPTCGSPSNGSLTITVTGYTGEVKYSLINSDDFSLSPAPVTSANHTHTFEDLTPNLYYCIVNGTNLTGTREFTLIYDKPFTATTSRIKGAGCLGQAVGTVGVTVNNGVAPYSYEWKDAGGATESSTTDVLDKIGPDTYSVIITDAVGCIITSASTEIIAEDVAISTPTVSNVICKGLATGIASVIASNGTGDLSYTWKKDDNSWTAPTTTNSFDQFPAGNYIVTATDDINCTASTNFSITEPANKITLNSSKTDIICKDSLTGKIDLTTSHGFSPLTYNWADGATTEDRTNLAAGDYSVTVTDAKGCEDNKTITLTQPATHVDGRIIESSKKMPLCNGDANGEASLEEVSPGTGITTVSWNDNGSTEMSRTDLKAIEYTITFKDGNGCTDVETLKLNQPDKLKARVVLNDGNDTKLPSSVPCNGDSYEVKVITSGGTGEKKYSWAHSTEKTQTLTIKKGTYTLTVTDANGCSVDTTFTLTEPEVLESTLSIADSDAILCKGKTGIISSAVVGGTKNYSYEWKDATDKVISTNAKSGNVLAGTYSLKVTDKNGCTDSDNIAITEPASHVNGGIIESSKKMPLCNGDANGKAELEIISNGTGVTTITWSDNSTAISRTDLTAEEYTITFKDEKGCTDVVTLELGQPEILNANILSSDGSNAALDKLLCFGDSTNVMVKVEGGTTPMKTFVWKDDENNIISDKQTTFLEDGRFTVTVTDANNCLASDNHSITQPTKLENTIQIQDAIKCFDGLGRVSSNISGGVSPYKYNWSNGSEEETSGMDYAGEYRLTVTDKNGCQESDTIELTEPELLEATITITPDVCNDITKGSMSVQATGGTITTDYSYLWSTNETSSTITNLEAKEYSVTVTDDNGCTVTETIDITDINKFYIDLEMTEVMCKDQSNGALVSTPVHGNAPYSYSWSDGSSEKDLTAAPQGIYTVTVTDVNGCTATATETITTKPIMYVQNSGTTETSCSGTSGSAYIEMASGATPYTYLWSTGENTDSITGLKVGYYSVKVSDANGCLDSLDFYVKDTSSLKVSISSPDTKIRCAGRADGEATAIPKLGTSPYKYSWSNGDDTREISNLTAGVYYINVKDVNGCTAIDSITFIEEDVLKVSIIDSSMVSCFGKNDGWALAEAKGGIAPYTTTWSNSTNKNLAANLVAGTYTATITDKSGCSVNNKITITEPEELVASIDKIKHVDCGGECTGEARILTTGGTAPISYLWSNSSTEAFVTNLCGGNHFVDATDANGCSVKETVSIEDENAVLSLTTDKKDPDCGVSNGKIAIIPAGGTAPYFYSWEDGTVDSLIENVPSGPYELTFTDSKGCSLDTILALNDVTTMTIDFERAASKFCSNANESYKATATNGTAPYEYLWSNGDKGQIADSLGNQQYSVEVTDNAGCKYSKVIDVVVEYIKIDLISKKDVDCFGDSTGVINISANNGVGSNYTYNWNNDSITNKITGLKAGTYTITVTETETGCPSTATYTISENSKIETHFITDIPSYCLDSTGILHAETIGGVGPYSYVWETGKTGAVLDKAWNDFISVDITDTKGCVVTDSAKVEDISNFTAFEKDRYLISCFGDSDGELEVGLNNGYAPFTYSWSHDVSLNSVRATGLKKGTYIVSITDNKKCKIDFPFTLADPDTMKFKITETSPILCNGGSGNLTVNTLGGHPGYTFSWSLNDEKLAETSLNLSDITTGIVKVSAVDSRGCKSDTLTYDFKQPEQIKADFTVKITGCGSIANSGEITIDTIIGHNPPYEFKWHDEASYTTYDGSTNISRTNLPEGEYVLSVKDVVGNCDNEFTNYTYPLVVHDIDTIIKHTHCNYYTSEELYAKVPNGDIEITQIVTKQMDYNNTDYYDTLKILTDYSIVWNDANKQTGRKASKLTEGSYNVTFTGKNECINTFLAAKIDALVNLTNKIETTENNIQDKITICFEDTLEITSIAVDSYTNGYTPADNSKTFVWESISANKPADLSSTSKQTITVDPLTTYYSDSTKITSMYTLDGCSSPTDEFVINHFDSVDFNLEVVDIFENYLGEDSVFAIKNDAILINPTHEPWYVWETEDNGILEISWKTKSIENGEQGHIADTITNKDSYLESDIYGLNFIVKEPTYFYATATSINGCIEKARIAINVYEDSFTTNLITPNGDGINDVWDIPYLHKCPNATVKIYNRWGVLVYQSEGEYYKNPWDGKNKNGGALPMSSYYYIIEYNDNNQTEPSAGTISIIY